MMLASSYLIFSLLTAAVVAEPFPPSALGLRVRELSGCIREEQDLRNAIARAKLSEKIVLCKNNKITLKNRPIDIDGKSFNLICEQDGCVIDGFRTPTLFIGKPTKVTYETIQFSNDASGRNGNGGCHNYSGGNIWFLSCHFYQCYADLSGGAIYAQQTNLQFDKCHFQENSAKKDGGSIALVQSVSKSIETRYEKNKADGNGGAVADHLSPNLAFIKCPMERNEAKIDGGAIFVQQSKLFVFGSTFRLNRSTNESGGAVYDEVGSTIVLDHSNLSRNDAHEFGGSVFLNKSHFVSAFCDYEYNSAGKQGGAIFDKEQSHISISDANFLNNEARTFDGGAINLDRSYATITASTFEGNAAKRDGGAIDDDEGASIIILADVEFIENSAGVDGGCAELDHSDALLYECNMKGNTAINKGGCLTILADSHVGLKSCKFNNNRARLGSDFFVADDPDAFVKCNDQTVFCDGFGGINDGGGFENTNCKDYALASGDGFCAAI